MWHVAAFVVHKSRGITTLSSMHSQQQQQFQLQHQQQQQQQTQQEPLVPARLRQAKEKNNVESKADERGLTDFYLIFHTYIMLLIRISFKCCVN